MNDHDVKLLNRRVERLNEEIKLNAPSIMIKLELQLIAEATNTLLQKIK